MINASGIFSYNHNNVSVDITWDRVGFEKNFLVVNHAIEKPTKGLKGTFVKNPNDGLILLARVLSQLILLLAVPWGNQIEPLPSAILGKSLMVKQHTCMKISANSTQLVLKSSRLLSGRL